MEGVLLASLSSSHQVSLCPSEIGSFQKFLATHRDSLPLWRPESPQKILILIAYRRLLRLMPSDSPYHIPGLFSNFYGCGTRKSFKLYFLWLFFSASSGLIGLVLFSTFDAELRLFWPPSFSPLIFPPLPPCGPERFFFETRGRVRQLQRSYVQ